MDNGRGFEPNGVQTEGHFGLAIMYERAEEINSQLTVISHPNAGTKVILQLPLDPSGENLE
jgi:signal transduction histidine kinase